MAADASVPSGPFQQPMASDGPPPQHSQQRPKSQSQNPQIQQDGNSRNQSSRAVERSSKSSATSEPRAAPKNGNETVPALHDEENKYLLQMLHTVSNKEGNTTNRDETKNPNVQTSNQSRPSKMKVNTEPTNRVANDAAKVVTKNSDTETFIEMEEKQSKKESKNNARSLTSWLFKAIVIATLLFMECSLIFSVVKNATRDENSTDSAPTVSSGKIAEETNIISYIQKLSEKFISRLSGFGSQRLFDSTSLSQFQRRLELGQNLIRKFDDPSGSEAACAGVAQAMIQKTSGEFRKVDSSHEKDSLMSSLSSSMPLFNEEESRILSDAYLCIGEARLSLFSSSFSSALGLKINDAKKEKLMYAKEGFEASTSIDPSNPSARSGLGLTFLLLGTMKPSCSDSVQYIFKSIQHLKAAVGLTSDATNTIEIGDGKDSNHEIGLIRTAAMHNLGLAFLALDDIALTEGLNGVKDTNFLEWMASLQDLESPHFLMESLAFSANEGALLLQMGKLEDAITSFEYTANEACNVDGQSDKSSSTIRQKEICSIIQRNLVVARGSLFGKEEVQKSNIDVTLGATIHDDIARWNAYVPVEQSVVALESSPGADNSGQNASNLLDDVVVSSSDGGGDEAPSPEVNITEDEEAPRDEEIEETAAGNNVEAESELVDETNSLVETPGDNIATNIAEGDPLSTPWGIKSNTMKGKPELQSALAALEKAASGEARRTRLLLALAKARSSAGDMTGAVDAALEAVGLAKSEEESETSTAYLEQLMEKLAGGSMKKAPEILPKETLVEAPDKRTAFVESRDHEVSELNLKLEIEKLKYKVLEQEMRWGLRNPPTFSESSRAIDYQQHDSHLKHAYPGMQKSEKVDVEKNIRRFDEPSVYDDLEDEVESAVITPSDVEVIQSKIDTTVNEIQLSPDNTKSEPIQDFNTSESAAIEENSGNEMLPSPEDSDPPLASLEEDETNENPTSLNETDIAIETVAENENDEDVLNTTAIEEDTLPTIEPIVLPSLYSPLLKPPSEMPPTAKSYMKLADAYLDKGKYSLATKQFLKVIKKAPDHLPAFLGYATALERLGNNKQIHDAVVAYGNATKVAITQGEEFDPLAKAGSGGMAESILRRAIQVTQSMSSGRLETLRTLSAYAHTAILAADIYYAIGMEIKRQGIDVKNNKAEAIEAFTFANEFIAMRNDTEAPFHAKSILEMGTIALDNDENAVEAVEYFNKAKALHLKDDDHVKLLVLSGRAHMSLGELEVAISDLTRALSFPECLSTASAHHELAISLTKSNGETHEIHQHFEKALEMGMDPTAEAIDALGEHNISVMRSINRQQWKSYNEAQSGSTGGGGGGVMSGGGVGSNNSVFAPKATQNEASAQSDTLNMLEQGAAAYDGHVPMGGEIEGGSESSNLSNLSGRKQR